MSKKYHEFYLFYLFKTELLLLATNQPKQKELRADHFHRVATKGIY